MAFCARRNNKNNNRVIVLLQVTWYLESHRILPDSRHLMEEHGTLAVLRLRDLSVRELGNYSCQAENNQGRARDHIELSGD